MTTETIKHLTFLKRDRGYKTPAITPGTALPPRETFKGHPDVLAAYDAYAHQITAWQDHRDAANRARAEAPAAVVTYRAELRTALAAGKPAENVTNREPVLLATAQAQDSLAEDARAAANAQGHVLARLISDVAPEVYPPAEAQIEAAALEVRAAIEGLRRAWSGWSAAWHLRGVLTTAHLYGGTLGGYRDSAPLPPDVTDALATLTAHLSDLETLRAEEGAVADWREREANAQATNTGATPRRLR